MMKFPIEVRCIVCRLVFCCAKCRWQHEQLTHDLQYDCPICRGYQYLCRPEDLNQHFLKHLTEDHLPLHCHKCSKVFKNMDDLSTIQECTSVSELIDKEYTPGGSKTVDEKFNWILEKDNNNDPDFEAIVSVNKDSRTAVITPVVRRKYIVDYESSEGEDEGKEELKTPHAKVTPKTPGIKQESNKGDEIIITPKANCESSEDENEEKEELKTPHVRNTLKTPDNTCDSSEGEDETVDEMKTPHAKLAPKTPRVKPRATPHVKKLLLSRQRAIEYDETSEVTESQEQPVVPKTTPLRDDKDVVPDIDNQMTTPTSHLPYLAKLVQAVTTSTPTHPEVGGWSMFTDQGADSPLSEIENGGSPAQNTVEEPLKGESSMIPPKLKSIIATGNRSRLGSQDSSEKQVTFQDSVETSMKTKKVKFAAGTVFPEEPKVKRVFRKPKRMLTPGPQRPQRKYACNPRFQALINRFEHQGMTVARTPNPRDRDPSESTPPVGEHANKPRAINFKEDSPVIEPENNSKESNELFRTCVDSPPANAGINNAITAFTANIAGSLQDCLTSALRTTEEETEIQFKFVITKKKVSVKRMVEDAREVENVGSVNKENIWTTVAKAVKTVFWGEGTNSDATTPHRTFDSDSSSASKRKREDMSDVDSPLNHKRHKYEGRIRGRPPLRRSKTWVSSLRTSQSAEQSSLLQKVSQDTEDNANQSF